MHLPTGYAEITINFGALGGGSDRSIVLGANAAAFGGSAADMAALVVDAYNDHLVDYVAAGWEAEEIRVKYGPRDSGEEAVVSSGIGTGTWSGSMMPPQVALLINKQTPLGGRKHKGRIYWPFCTEAYADDTGDIGSTQAANVTDKFEDFRTQLNGVNVDLVLLHAHPDDEPNLITALTCQTKIATQRRRLRH